MHVNLELFHGKSTHVTGCSKNDPPKFIIDIVNGLFLLRVHSTVHGWFPSILRSWFPWISQLQIFNTGAKSCGLWSSCSLPSCRVRCILVLSGFSRIFVKPRSKLNTETCYWCGSCWPTTCSVAGYVLMFFRQDLKHRRRSVDFYDVESVCVKAAFEWGHVVVVGVFFVNTALRLECDVERRRYDVVSDCVFCTKKTYELSNAGNSRLNANTLSHILWSFYFSRSKYYATLISTKRLECAESKLNKATVDS